MSRLSTAAAFAALFVVSTSAYAQSGAPAPAAGSKAEQAAAAAKAAEAEQKFLKSLTQRSGRITLKDANVTLNVPQGYYFLDAGDAKRVLKVWGNPDEATTGVLGMIFPADATALDNTWGAVVSYDATGYVSDKDAKSTDYGKLLSDMQGNEDALNERRKKAGVDAQHLVGWAQQPSYDPARHVLIWAKDLKFGAQTDDTLNYDVRVLGRRGVLSLNMVSSMSHLAEMRTAAEGVAPLAAFDDGARYEQFSPAVDKKAGYGIAGLVAGGALVVAAKKFGLLAGLLLVAKKGAAFLLAGAAGLGAWFKRTFKRGDRTPKAPSAEV